MGPDHGQRIACDRGSFEAFYRDNVDAIESFITRRISDPYEVADVMADVFLICRVVCQVGRVDRAHSVGWWLWSGERGAGLGVGVASLMMRGLGTPGPGFVLPACAV
jgi:hypothetical protein